MKRIFGIALWITLGGQLAWANATDSLKIALDYQTNPEERTATLYHIAYNYALAGDETALDYISQGLLESEAVELHQRQASFYFLEGYYHHNFTSDFAKAFLAFTYARELYQQEGDLLQAGRVAVRLATYLFESGYYQDAEAIYTEVQAGFITEGSTADIAIVHEHLGFLHQEQGNWEASITEFSLALSYFQKTENLAGAAKSALNIGHAHRLLNQHDDALHYLGKAVEYAQASSSPLMEESYALFQKGMVFEDQGEVAKAQAIMREGYLLAYAQQPSNPESFRMASTLANSYLKAGNTSQAIVLLEQQQSHLPEEHIHTLQLNLYTTLAQAYEADQQWAKALTMERAYSQGAVAQTEAEALAAVAKKSSEVALAQKVLADREELVQQARLRNLWILIIALLVVSATGIVAYLYRIKEKYRKKALANATHWPELNQKIQDLEEALHLM